MARGSTELTKGVGVVGGLALKAIGDMLRTGSGAPTDGTSGTGAGYIGLSGQYWDTASGLVWTNIGTKASPRWCMVQATQRFAVSSASILAMNGAPVQLIAAPAANRMLVIDSITFVMTTTATAYANGGAVSFTIASGGVAAHSGSVPAAVVTAGAGTDIRFLGPATVANGTDYGTIAAAAAGLFITNATAPFITGTGTAVVYVTYAIQPTN